VSADLLTPIISAARQELDIRLDIKNALDQSPEDS
jgi:hypothetical protein